MVLEAFGEASKAGNAILWVPSIADKEWPEMWFLQTQRFFRGRACDDFLYSRVLEIPSFFCPCLAESRQ